MRCPFCQADLNDGAKFCLKCGKKIPRCPTCGDVITERKKFCGRDGTMLPSEVLELLPEEPAVNLRKRTESAPQQQTPQQPHQQPRRVYCAKCGKISSDGQSPCPACRAKAAGARRQPGAYQQPKNSNLPLILIIIGAVILSLLLVVAGYAAITGHIPFVREKEEVSYREDTENREDKDKNENGSSFFNPGEKTVEATAPVAEEPAVEVPVETVAPATEAPTEAPTEPPTQPPAEPEVDEDERVLYILDNCHRKYLSSSDLEGFDKEMCRIVRNGIYARSGRKFNDSALQDYFEQYDWYSPRIDPASFSGDMLNEYQIANLNLIMKYETERGY